MMRVNLSVPVIVGCLIQKEEMVMNDVGRPKMDMNLSSSSISPQKRVKADSGIKPTGQSLTADEFGQTTGEHGKNKFTHTEFTTATTDDRGLGKADREISDDQLGIDTMQSKGAQLEANDFTPRDANGVPEQAFHPELSEQGNGGIPLLEVPQGVLMVRIHSECIASESCWELYSSCTAC